MKPLNRKVAEMATALRAAKRVLVADRKDQFECVTIPPNRSYDQMNADERAFIRRYDRALAKINAALE